MSTILPAEWAPQSAVMLTWPHPATAWRPHLPEVERVMCEIAKHIALREQCLIVARDAGHRTHIEKTLRNSDVEISNIQFFIAPSNDSWARDHGPICVFENDKPVVLDFIFNGWGNKFAAELDNRITATIAAQHAFGAHQIRDLNFVLEGGSIESDGLGTLLTTRRCLSSPQRNPGYSVADIESYLKQTLGVTRILWLDHGYLAGDDTDSHIDTLARLCDEHTIAYVSCDDPDDEHYAELKAMEKELQALRDAQGNPYTLAALPWPGAQYNDAGERLPATYANFLIINGTVLMPTYADTHDDAARATLQRCFPKHVIIGIDCRPIIRQYGSLHCLTMQIPAGVVTFAQAQRP
ncbi:MAG: agmatine deiminase family protein [Pseudomonadota bacterium]